jgi:hypothetical protein
VVEAGAAVAAATSCTWTVKALKQELRARGLKISGIYNNDIIDNDTTC